MFERMDMTKAEAYLNIVVIKKQRNVIMLSNQLQKQ